jgi:transcriptional regulator with XRE-family HTH domain
MLSTKQRAKLVGERIVAARKRKGMSQVDLAAALAKRYGKEPETVRRSLVNNETGRYAPRLHMLQAIAEETEQPLEFFTVAEVDGGSPFRDAA